MSDFRKFCWGMFVGLTGSATALGLGFERQPNAVASPGEAVITMGLALGCLVVMAFGNERAERAKGQGK